MKLPSIQLLNAVYPTNEDSETYVGIQESTNRIMHFGKEFNDCRSEIDIHNVANKCKRWAHTKGYTIIDYIDLDNEEFWTCRAYPYGLNDGFDYEETYQISSPEAIFKTCEWILKEIS